jgi:hypothetical protein
VEGLHRGPCARSPSRRYCAISHQCLTRQQTAPMRRTRKKDLRSTRVLDRHCNLARHSRAVHRAEDWPENLAVSFDANFAIRRRRSCLALKTNPPTSPLLKRSGGVCRSGGKGCRSGVEVSKQSVEAAVCLAFAPREDVEATPPRMSKSLSKGCRSTRTSTRGANLLRSRRVQIGWAAKQRRRICAQPAPPSAELPQPLSLPRP